MSRLPVVGIIMVAVAARAWLLFGTHYMPGVNGAYYLVQARSLIERGVLGIPDMPLTFHLHAALAWLLAKMSGMAQAEAIVWVVKLCDAALPPLVAWPVFLLVQRWAKARGQGDAVPLAAAALACFAWPWFRMVGELQKNSLALVWLGVLAMTLHGWLGAPTIKRGCAVLACLLLLGLTHIGVLGATVVMLAAVMLAFTALQGGYARWRHVLPWIAAGSVILGLAAALVLWKFDPVRIHRLISALRNPAEFSEAGMQMPVPPHSRMNPVRWLPSIAFAAVVVPGLVLAWRRRGSQPAADVALVAGAAITVLAMTGPWFSMDKAMRFYLIALLPAIVVAAFGALHITSPWMRGCVIGATLLIGIGSTLTTLRLGGSAILSDSAMIELRSLAQHISRPERTLVCAQHGVEWWTAWFLHTRIAQASALRSEDWQRYDSVCFLEIKSGLHMPFGPGGGRPPGGDPRGFSPPGPGLPDGMAPPPARGANPMMSAPIPPDAEVLHDGACLKFARVATPPDGILSRIGKTPSPRSGPGGDRDTTALKTNSLFQVAFKMS